MKLESVAPGSLVVAICLLAGAACSSSPTSSTATSTSATEPTTLLAGAETGGRTQDDPPPTTTTLATTAVTVPVDPGEIVVEPSSGLLPGDQMEVSVRCGPRRIVHDTDDEPAGDVVVVYFELPRHGRPDASRRHVIAHEPIEATHADVAVTVPYWMGPGSHLVGASCGGRHDPAATTIVVDRRPGTPETVQDPWRVVDGPWVHPETEFAHWSHNVLTLDARDGATYGFGARCEAGVDTTGAAFYVWAELADDPETHLEREPFVAVYPAQWFVPEPDGRTLMGAEITFRLDEFPSPEERWGQETTMVAHCTAIETPFEPATTPAHIKFPEPDDPTKIELWISPADP